MLLRGNSEPKEANLHRIFGKEENVAYLDRRGAYIIPIKGEEIGVVETPKGLFLLGGGIDGDETDNQCIIRECIEEAGYQVEIKERVCSAETYYEHPTIGFFHPIQVYYSGKLVKKVKEPVECLDGLNMKILEEKCAWKCKIGQ